MGFGLGASPAQSNGVADSAFAGWPEGWKKTYRGFEEYIAARRESWGPSKLEVLPDGSIIHGVPMGDQEMRLNLRVFKNGRHVVSRDAKQGFRLKQDHALTSPGRYAACLYSITKLTTQHILPIVWFEIPSGKEGGAEDPRDASFQVVKPPDDPENWWPNERMTLYLDYHLLPKRYSFEIETVNAKVDPTIVLWVTPDGTVERDELNDKGAEALLRWRIYHDGKLVERGPASSVTRWKSPFGPGSYQILMGVEGPAGFMPVSNVLEFPLFPDVDGKEVVHPADANEDGVPDFLAQMVAERKLHLSEVPAPDGRLQISGNDSNSEGVADLWRSWDTGKKAKRLMVRTGRRAANVAAPKDVLLERSGNTQLTLQWKGASGNVTGFGIYRKNAVGELELVATLPADATSYEDDDISLGETYSYAIDSF